MNRDVICSNCNNTFDPYKGSCPYCGTQLPNSVMAQIKTIEQQQQGMQQQELVNSEGKVLNNVQNVDPVLSKIPSVPPGTIEEINNTFAQEQLAQQQQAMMATYKKEDDWDKLKLSYFAMFGAAVLDIVLSMFITRGNLLSQVLIDGFVCAISVAGAVLSAKKSKTIFIVSIAAAILAILSFSLPFLAGIVMVFFAYKIYKKKA